MPNNPATPAPAELAQQCREAANELPGIAHLRARRTLRDAAAELDRLHREVKQLGVERDAFVRAGTKWLHAHRDLASRVDAHVASKVYQQYVSDPSWVASGLAGVFNTREEAEAAYRARTNLHTEASASREGA